MRVAVRSGDGKKFLGYGTYFNKVTVYCILLPDGDLVSRQNPEERPSDEEIAESGGELKVFEDNPKIVLDDGRVVYGCQIWWDEVEAPLN